MIFTNGLILGSYDGDGMNHGKKRNAVFWGIGEVVGARRRSCMKRKRILLARLVVVIVFLVKGNFVIDLQKIIIRSIFSTVTFHEYCFSP